MATEQEKSRAHCPLRTSLYSSAHEPESGYGIEVEGTRAYIKWKGTSGVIRSIGLFIQTEEALDNTVATLTAPKGQIKIQLNEQGETVYAGVKTFRGTVQPNNELILKTGGKIESISVVVTYQPNL